MLHVYGITRNVLVNIFTYRVCEWLDELQAGAIRQAQVSFSARIPSAFPLGDATTMCTPAALYHAAAQPLYVRHRTKPVTPGKFSFSQL